MSRAATERYIDKYVNAIAEPARDARCDPRILAQSKATQSARHRFTDGFGLRRERMPMAVIVTSYFLRAGNVMSATLMDIAYREDPSTIASSGNGPPPRSGEVQ